MKNLSFVKKFVLAGTTLALSAFALVSLGSATSVAAATCADGSNWKNWDGKIVSKDTMQVWLKDGKKLCKDTNVNFASFVAPANYNGKGFKGNPTALPQHQFYNRTVTLNKGTDGKTTQKISVPDECTNYQIDAYLGPVQKDITNAAGFIDTHNIVGKLFQKTKSDCSVPKVKACNVNTGLYEMVEKGKENTAPYTTNFDNCEKTKACNIQTGVIDTITKEEAKSSNYTTNFEKCEKATVCNTDTGKVVTVTKDEAKNPKYVDEDSEECHPIPVIPVTPVTPETPVTPTPPEEIPSTGPTEIISGVAGIGSLAGASSMYIRSRRALRR